MFRASSINFGRAPVSDVFDKALDVAIENQSKLASMISHRLPLSSAPEAYKLFEGQLARKVLLSP
jgi:threonine dehydrogenase-like Zn-dependent dehydrogenase